MSPVVPRIAVGARVLALLLLAAAGAAPRAQDARPERPAGAPRNVILFIGDGLGASAVTLARLVGGEALALDAMLVGSQSVAPVGAVIPDSAATATAMATGVNSVNGAIGVDPAGRPLTTLLEAARDRGLATGIVTSTRITHATPAAFAAHVPSRAMEDAIAEQLLGSGVDLLIGGGARHFLSTGQGGRRHDGRDLLVEAAENGWHVVRDGGNLRAAVALDPDERRPLLALLHQDHLPYRLDAPPWHDIGSAEKPDDRPSHVPDLEELTLLAVQFLDDDPDGFLLIVEGGRIDHAEHQHDAAAAARETLDFDRAVSVGRWREWGPPGDTLVLVTADHETGGLALGRDGVHDFDTGPLRAARASLGSVVARLRDGGDVPALLTGDLGLTDVTPAELERVVSLAHSDAGDAERQLLAALADMVSVRTGVDWTTWHHTAADVPVWAVGPGAATFAGHHPNTHIARGLAKLLGLELDPEPAAAAAATGGTR